MNVWRGVKRGSKDGRENTGEGQKSKAEGRVNVRGKERRRQNSMKQRGVGGGNLRFESCVLQSELLEAIGLADRVKNLVHHLGPLQIEQQLMTSPGEQLDPVFSRTNTRDDHHDFSADGRTLCDTDSSPLRKARKL